MCAMKTIKGAPMRRNYVGQPGKEQATPNLRPKRYKGASHLQSVLQAEQAPSKMSP